MNRTEIYHWFNSITQISPEEKSALLNTFGIDEILSWNDEEKIGGYLKETAVDPIKAGIICNKKFREDSRRVFENAVNRGICSVCPEDGEYPVKLKELYVMPLCLYYIGRLPENTEPILAVVGSRQCSDYGLRMSGYFGRGMAVNRISVISGMALGIDGETQKAVLERGGTTYAVLGSGVDVPYPLQNLELYKSIPVKGGLISEVPPGSEPSAINFPRRNRIISALSDGILLIEAKFRSGALITVNYGLEQGKEIMAVPGRIEDIMSEGCLDMIRSGASPATCVEDVVKMIKGIVK